MRPRGSAPCACVCAFCVARRRYRFLGRLPVPQLLKERNGGLPEMAGRVPPLAISSAEPPLRVGVPSPRCFSPMLRPQFRIWLRPCACVCCEPSSVSGWVRGIQSSPVFLFAQLLQSVHFLRERCNNVLHPSGHRNFRFLVGNGRGFAQDFSSLFVFSTSCIVRLFLRLLFLFQNTTRFSLAHFQRNAKDDLTSEELDFFYYRRRGGHDPICCNLFGFRPIEHQSIFAWLAVEYLPRPSLPPCVAWRPCFLAPP